MTTSPHKIKNTALPRKPSKLIRLALADLTRVERSKKYVVDMDHFHFPNFDPDRVTCSVCFAGAVMAKTLDANPKIFHLPSEYPPKVRDQLAALDQFRQGKVADGLLYLGIAKPQGIGSTRTVFPHESDPAEFKADMHKLANHLESLKL